MPLAQETGGREFEADSLTNLSTAFAGIAEELRRQYSIGYYPDKVGQSRGAAFDLDPCESA